MDPLTSKDNREKADDILNTQDSRQQYQQSNLTKDSNRTNPRTSTPNSTIEYTDTNVNSFSDCSGGGYIYRQKTSEELVKEHQNLSALGAEPVSYNVNIKNFTNPNSYPFVVRSISNNSDILRNISNISETSISTSSKNDGKNIRKGGGVRAGEGNVNVEFKNRGENRNLEDSNFGIQLTEPSSYLNKHGLLNKRNLNTSLVEVDIEEDDLGDNEGEHSTFLNGCICLGTKDDVKNTSTSYCGQSKCCQKTSETIYSMLLSMLPQHIRRRSKNIKCPTVKETALGIASNFALPYFPWMNLTLHQYYQYFADDLVAGITVGILLVPQGLSYALVANLPPIYGLYTAIAGYIYTFFGTSGELNLGPVALVSLFLPEAFKAMGLSLEETPEAIYFRVQAGICLGTVVGCTLILMGFLKLGNLMKYISPSVMTGFVTGSGIYIGFSQMKYMFGIHPDIKENNYQDYIELFSKVLTESQKWPVIIGWVSYGVMLTCNILKKRFSPNEERNKSKWYRFFRLLMTFSTLIVVIASTLIAAYLKNNGHDLQTVGAVPAGMNPFVYPNFASLPVSFSDLVLASIPCTILVYMESVSVARKYSIARGYNIDPTQELWAVGITNLIASFFSSYPPGGAFSRTAVAAESGVRSPIANIYTSLFVSIVLACATSLLYYVPFAVLGAVINVAVISLMDFGEMWRALWISPVDFFVMFVTFVITTFIDVQKGLEYGILVSIIVLLYQISKLDVESVGQLRTNYHHPAFPVRFKKLKSYPTATEHPEIRILRLTANLFFGNIGAFRDEYYNTITIKNHNGNTIRAIIVDAQGVAEVDFASLAVIDELIEETRKRNILLYFSEANDRLVTSLDSYNIIEDIGGPEMITLSVEDVFNFLVNKFEVEKMIRVKENRFASNSFDDSSIQNIDYKNEDFDSFYPMKPMNIENETTDSVKSNYSKENAETKEAFDDN